ncbi:glycosyltransferase family 4 protein [Labrenzia sp. VG12]|uniref:glycosyltransferase family 4 protein n=1 Tax=Labrenzia sp. VG12 TaxID=2021862 RepID=UPI000B8C368E|nr:glycosyltransferase family 4 protein [Labrenzia sp. VG12]ASP35865.1 hypothetical protein CHH27_23630 [Labrenzia sp. VG12]
MDWRIGYQAISSFSGLFQMRIALLNSLFPELGIGGSEMSTFYLAKGLKQLGHTVHVFSENDSESTVWEKYRDIDVLRIGAPLGYGPNIFATPRLEREYWRNESEESSSILARFEKHISEFRPNIIHTNVIGGTVGFWNLAREMGIPVVHTLRSYSLLCHRRMLRGHVPCKRVCSACLNPSREKSRIESNKVTSVVAISQHVMDVFRKSGWFADVEHRHVIGNSYEVSDVLFEESGGEKKYDFGYIGRLHETKGLELLIEQFSRLRKEIDKDLKLLIAGDGNPDYVNRLRQLAPSDGVEFAGYLSPTQFFALVRICVVPSIWYEPFGRVFAESLHHGVPVIGSKRGGGAEILDDSTGWLFDPIHPEQLRDAMISAFGLGDDGYQQMRQGCLAQAEQYSVKAIAEKYSSIYEKCLGISS